MAELYLNSIIKHKIHSVSAAQRLIRAYLCPSVVPSPLRETLGLIIMSLAFSAFLARPSSEGPSGFVNYLHGLFWMVVLLASLFEPFLLLGWTQRRLQSMSWQSILCRGIASGCLAAVVIFASWLAMKTYVESETVILVAGYFLCLLSGAIGLAWRRIKKAA